MSWEKYPGALKERYENISEVDWGQMKIAMLEEMNKECLTVSQGDHSRSYEIFASQFNSIMLTAHFYENLFLFENARHEHMGNLEFQFNIPEEYFRHPSLRSANSFTREERDRIAEAVKITKSRMNFSKDESFVIGQLHKLEFVSVFSFLEAYIENLMVEFLGIDETKASKTVSKKALPQLFTEVFNKINPDIIDVINMVEPDAIKFLSLCRRVRNLHMHNLGVVTQRFFKECIEEDLLSYDLYADTKKPHTEYARPNFKFWDYIIKVGKPINLNGISQPFRLLAREIVFISEAFCKEEVRKRGVPG